MAKYTRQIFRILLTVVLLSMTGWTILNNWRQGTSHFESFRYSEEEAKKFIKYPKIQYAIGMDAWTRQDTASAARYFRNSISSDVLFIDGWLRLAEAEATMQNKKKAKAILSYTIGITQNVYRWKWPQMLLASELGMEKILYGNANYLLSNGLLKQDALQFLHSHFNSNAQTVVSVLNREHWKSYLEWLMNWSMVKESLSVWKVMKNQTTPQKKTALQYANFLLHNKYIKESKEIWQEYTGKAGISNPGFETQYTGMGFDWRSWKEKDGIYEVTRVNRNVREGDYALKIQFWGSENVDFYHFYQIFTTEPSAKYRLTYAWKSQGITTDEGPFIEIIGYDNDGVYAAGPKVSGTHQWREVIIDFDVPEGCHACIVRLRRQPSDRFDSKLKGTVWLDDFQVEKIGTYYSSLNLK